MVTVPSSPLAPSVPVSTVRPDLLFSDSVPPSAVPVSQASMPSPQT